MNASTFAPSAQIVNIADRFQGKWVHHVCIAKIAWGRLTEDELLLTGGGSEQLARLIEQRYSLSRVAANEHVEKLVQKCGY